jgi:RNA polymerase sigma-70 factor (ECF subfamily)
MDQMDAPAASSVMLASAFVTSGPLPSEGVIREEDLERLELGLEELQAIDREVLALRHFEQLSNLEVAQLLGIKESTASQRYLRAVDRLRSLLETPDEHE